MSKSVETRTARFDHQCAKCYKVIPKGAEYIAVISFCKKYTNQQKALRWKTVLSSYSQQFNIHISFGMLCWLIQFILAFNYKTQIYKGGHQWQHEN